MLEALLRFLLALAPLADRDALGDPLTFQRHLLQRISD